MLYAPGRLLSPIAGGVPPSLDLNFLGGTMPGSVTFTRASAAWAYNSSGVLTSYATNTPRFDYDPVTLAAKGLLLEEARTNSVRNSSGGGSVAGTSGTLPTNWNQPSLTTGITRTVVGSGTSNGLPYVDIQYSGTASGSTDTVIFYESSSNIAAANLATWTSSTFIALVGGSLSGVTAKQGLRYRAAAGVSIGTQVFETTFVPTATLTRYATSATGSDATIAFVVPSLTLTLAPGAIDVTLRHSVPQAELGAFATSPVLTTTVAVTRAADACTITTLTPWFSAAAGTLLVEVAVTGAKPAGNQIAAMLDDGTSSNRIGVFATNGAGLMAATVDVGGANQFASTNAAPVAGTVYKLAMAWTANDYRAARDGTLGTADVSGSIPTVTQMRIGHRSTDQLNGWVRRLRYYSSRLPNASLQVITS
jgi:hypothetical protein